MRGRMAARFDERLPHGPLYPLRLRACCGNPHRRRRTGGARRRRALRDPGHPLADRPWRRRSARPKGQMAGPASRPTSTRRGGGIKGRLVKLVVLRRPVAAAAIGRAASPKSSSSANRPRSSGPASRRRSAARTRRSWPRPGPLMFCLSPARFGPSWLEVTSSPRASRRATPHRSWCAISASAAGRGSP